MFYDKRTQRKIQLLNLLIALLILIPILLDFSKGFMMGLNSSVIGFQNGLEESTFQICTVKPDSLQLNHIGTIPSLNLSSDNRRISARKNTTVHRAFRQTIRNPASRIIASGNRSIEAGSQRAHE